MLKEITVQEAQAAYTKNGLTPQCCNIVPSLRGECCVVGAVITDKYGMPRYTGGDSDNKLLLLIKEYGREYVYGLMYGFDDGPTGFLNSVLEGDQSENYKAGYVRGVEIHKVMFNK